MSAPSTPDLRAILLALIQGKIRKANELWKTGSGVFPTLLPEEAAIIRKWMGCGNPPPGGKKMIQLALDRLFPR